MGSLQQGNAHSIHSFFSRLKTFWDSNRSVFLISTWAWRLGQLIKCKLKIGFSFFFLFLSLSSSLSLSLPFSAQSVSTKCQHEVSALPFVSIPKLMPTRSAARGVRRLSCRDSQCLWGKEGRQSHKKKKSTLNVSNVSIKITPGGARLLIRIHRFWNIRTSEEEQVLRIWKGRNLFKCLSCCSIAKRKSAKWTPNSLNKSMTALRSFCWFRTVSSSSCKCDSSELLHCIAISVSVSFICWCLDPVEITSYIKNALVRYMKYTLAKNANFLFYSVFEKGKSENVI